MPLPYCFVSATAGGYEIMMNCLENPLIELFHRYFLVGIYHLLLFIPVTVHLEVLLAGFCQVSNYPVASSLLFNLFFVFFLDYLNRAGGRLRRRCSYVSSGCRGLCVLLLPDIWDCRLSKKGSFRYNIIFKIQGSDLEIKYVIPIVPVWWSIQDCR